MFPIACKLSSMEPRLEPVHERAHRVADAPSGTAAIDKTMAVLDLVALAVTPPAFAELVDASGLPRGTLHRLLAALVRHGMVALSPERRYVGGIHLLELARRTWESSDLRLAAHESIRALSRRTHETVHLATLDHDSVVYIDKVECDYPLRLHSAIGKRGPVHCTAVGKAMAASLDDAEREALVGRLELRRFTDATLTSRPALWKALAAIRACGVAFDREEHAVGVHCVAAPVFDLRGRCVGGISLTAPVSRVGAKALAALARPVRDAAAAATRRLGGVVPGTRPPRAKRRT
jgi:DNA-binding IclR family transcriptional regulator